jgi:hypothetical protein
MNACEKLCLLLALTAAGSTVGCRPPKEEKPAAPDMSELLQAYDHPGDGIGEQDLDALYAAFCRTFSVTGEICGWEAVQDMVCAADDPGCSACAGLDPIFEALNAAGVDLQSGGVDADAGVAAASVGGAGDGDGAGHGEDATTIFSGEGWARLTRVCGGHGKQPVADRENGTVALTVGFSDRGLDRVIWGDFDACKMSIAGRDIELDGQVRVDLGGVLALGGPLEFRPTVQVQGALTSGGETQQVSIDFRLGFDNGPGISLRVPLTDHEQVIVFIDRDGPVLLLSEGEQALDAEKLACEG